MLAVMLINVLYNPECSTVTAVIRRNINTAQGHNQYLYKTTAHQLYISAVTIIILLLYTLKKYPYLTVAVVEYIVRGHS